MKANRTSIFVVVILTVGFGERIFAAQEPGQQKAADKPEGAAKEEVWDSLRMQNYPSSAAVDVTKTVRVEDIVEPPSDYHYAAFGKDDPFIAPIVSSTQKRKDGGPEIPIVSPLQRYNLSELALVGTWQVDSGESKALVLTPKDEGIIASIGDPIGVKGGKIIAIENDQVTVREYAEADDRTRIFSDQNLLLGSKERPDDLVTLNPSPTGDNGTSAQQLAPLAGAGGESAKGGAPAVAAPAGFESAASAGVNAEPTPAPTIPNNQAPKSFIPGVIPATDEKKSSSQ